MSKVSIRTIAKTVGCSPSTVSRALSGSAGVNPEVRRKILDAIRSSGYRQSKPIVAVVISSYYLVGYAGRLCSALLRELQTHAFEPIVVPFHNLDVLTRIPLSAVVAATYDSQLEHWWGKQNNIPLVTINQKPEHLDGVYLVGSNFDEGARTLCELLAGHGHRRVARLGGASLLLDGATHVGTVLNKAFRKYFKKYQMTDLPVLCGYEFVPMVEKMKEILASDVTALIVENHLYIPSLLQILRMLNVRVPEDLSIAAYSFPEESDFMNPPLTCLAEDFDELAVQTGLMLTRMLDGIPVPGDVVVPYRFFYGASVKNIVS